MQLDCPKCKTSFSVNLSQIGESRQVECSVCGNKWIAKNSDLQEVENTFEEKKIPDSNFGKTKYLLFLLVFLIGTIGLVFLEKEQLTNSHSLWGKFFKLFNF
tara:strand:- start:79 stop:384 length:306 start_codon:yes stop_codon:yes gene_type:complete